MEDTQNQARKDSLPLFDDVSETPAETSAETSAGAVSQLSGHVAVPASIPLPGPRSVPETETVSEASVPPPVTAVRPESHPVPGRTPDRPPATTAAPPPRPAFRRPGGESGEQAGFGAYLRELRQQRRMSPSEVGEATKIRSIYIEAIEAEDYSSLPPVVYVLAYVKTLCAFYGVDDALMESLTADIRQRLEYEAPGDPSKSVVDMELSEENPILLKRILLVAGAGVFFITVLLTLLVLALTSDSGAESSVPQGGAPAALEEKQLLEMQPAPVLEVVPLPPESGR